MVGPFATKMGMTSMRGGTDPPPPPENSQNIGFPCNTGPDPLKLQNYQARHSVLGHHQGFHKEEGGGEFPLLLRHVFLLLLMNLYRVYRQYCQITLLLCLDTRMPKKLMKSCIIGTPAKCHLNCVSLASRR